MLQLIEQGKTHEEICTYIKGLSDATLKKVFPNSENSSDEESNTSLQDSHQPDAILDLLPTACVNEGTIETVKLFLFYGINPRLKGSKVGI